MSERQDKVTKQLDDFLGVEDDEVWPIKELEKLPAVKEDKVPAVLPDIDYDTEMVRSLDEMEKLNNLGTQAFENAVEMYSSYGKDRTIDVAASLLKSLTSLKTEKRETLKALFDKKDDKDDTGKSVNNLNIYTENIKDLLKNIPVQKVVAVDRSDYSENKDVHYELSILKEHESKLKEIKFKEYEIEVLEKTITLSFNSASNMNRFKFGMIEKFGKDIVI